MPSASLGSNQVDLGGMMPPLSEICIKSATLTGEYEVELIHCEHPAAYFIAWSKGERQTGTLRLCVEHASEHLAWLAGNEGVTALAAVRIH